jgi:hypothetical protein
MSAAAKEMPLWRPPGEITGSLGGASITGVSIEIAYHLLLLSHEPPVASTGPLKEKREKREKKTKESDSWFFSSRFKQPPGETTGSKSWASISGVTCQ